MLNSVVCRAEHFDQPWFRRWFGELGLRRDPEDGGHRRHRKDWEHCAVVQTLHERGFLAAGRRGLGFAVGREPLPSLFARYGVDVVATDAPPSRARSAAWARSGEHASARDELYAPQVVDRAAFDARVTFEPADMNGGFPWEPGSFDFVWSCCAFEHLGGLERGLRFVERSAALLRPGGIAVHTTEYNVSSDDRTVARGPGVIYRRRDLEALDRRLRRVERCLAPLDLWPGDERDDLRYDVRPYGATGREHVKLFLDGYVVTSFLLTVIT